MHIAAMKVNTIAEMVFLVNEAMMPLKQQILSFLEILQPIHSLIHHTLLDHTEDLKTLNTALPQSLSTPLML
ncbi:hypothetical protein DPMN_135679 [Dreissena polymorpha]|uniref:Uncharacterized protein n=1 Tax=Dreissena polymorpha TaxID=45954 RepID=A0A9D4G205_DREPO|nr:hypothetical protein DPMN_135679 [Dreissena polymorpha]